MPRTSRGWRRFVLPLLAGVPATAAFVSIVKSVADKSATRSDDYCRRKVVGFRSPAFDATSFVVTALTAPAANISGCMLLALKYRERGARVWLPLVLSPVASMTAGKLFSLYLPQHPPPTSDKDEECEPCFPSGHTTGVTAEALTAAYVLRRAGVISRGAVIPLLLPPVAGGLNRLYRDRHWATDVTAGLSAGTAIAAILAVLSETMS